MTNLRRSAKIIEDFASRVWFYRILVIAVFASAMVLAVAIVANLPRQYVAGANVLVVNGNTRDDPTLQSADLPSIATSTVVLNRMRKALALDLPIMTVKRHLSVKTPPFKSSILSVEYTDVYPWRAALVANSVADEMTKYFGEVSTSRFDSDLRGLDAELAKQRDRIASIDTKMRAQGDFAAAALDDKGVDAIAGRVADLESERALSTAALTSDASYLQALDRGSGSRSAIARAEVLQNDSVYHELRGVVASGTTALANERAVYTGKFPGLPALKTKVDRLTATLSTEEKRALASPNAFSLSAETFAAEGRKAAAAATADRAKLAAVNGLLRTQRERLAARPPLEMLRLERSAAQADYLAISARRATALANRADALSLGSVVVVDRAIASENQVGLTRGKLTLALALLALALAIGSAFLAEALDPRLRRTTHIEDLYGSAVVGTLGKI